MGGAVKDKLALTLLGQADVRLAGKPVSGFYSGKAQALLFYLAVTGQTHTRPALAGLLWADLPDSDALTNLRQVLSNLRKLVGPYLAITRQMVTIKQDSDYWLDVAVFLAGVDGSSKPSPQPSPSGRGGDRSEAKGGGEGMSSKVARLRRAVDLYQGDFLAGFYVRDAPLFEEWQLVQRAHLRELALNALQKLAKQFAQQRDYENGIAYSRRLLALEPWHEPAHRQLMHFYAQTGQQAAALRQYDLCRQMLEDELGVAPNAETTALYEQIRDKKIGPADLPPFLIEKAEPAEPELTHFVARERELADLTETLATAKSGQGQILFVIGGAGRGKTTLVQEFTRQALAVDPALIVLSGNCNLHTGTGDPYLPFRDALGLLLGDVKARWAGGLISQVQARRLWQVMPLTLSTLVEHAPGLIDNFVSGPPLLARAATFAPPNAAWFVRLTEIVETRQQVPLEQKRIFAEYTTLLKAVAAQRPILLIIEDLQWVDPSSSDLLFHLSREVGDSPILLVGTYRPEEVPLSQPTAESAQAGRHPLAGIVSELKRRHGDIWLDLGDLAPQEGRRFIEVYLDTQPNRLNQAFRQELFRRTGGHALFTVELLREMVDRGDICQDDQGVWVAGEVINWHKLPARVEGVIERRIHRLEEALQAVLTIACVEGERFTAEVVARVQQLNERGLVQRLSQELDKQHRLVTAQALERLNPDGQRLSIYRFRHQLFQHYLYRRLDATERAYLHEEVGTVLEILYDGQTNKIAVQLARHFEEAGLAEKAVAYLCQAGERARQLSAYREALAHFERALALLETLAPSVERTHQEITVYAALGFLHQMTKGLGAPESEESYERAWQLCQHADLADTSQSFQVQWGLWLYYAVRSDYRKAGELAQRLGALSQKMRDPTLVLPSHRAVGTTHFWMGQFVPARPHWDEVFTHYQPRDLALSFLYGGTDVKLHCMALGAQTLCWLGYPDQGLRMSQELLPFAQDLSHPYSLAAAYFFAAWFHASRRERTAAQPLAEEAVRLSNEYGFPFWLGVGGIVRVYALAGDGQAEARIPEMQQALATYQKTGATIFRVQGLGMLAEMCGDAGQIEQGLAVVDEALATTNKTDERYWEANLHRLKGELLSKAGADEEAEACFLKAIEVAQHQQAKFFELRAVTSLSRLRQQQNRPAEAHQMLAEIYNWFTEGFDTLDLQEAKVLLAALS